MARAGYVQVANWIGKRAASETEELKASMVRVLVGLQSVSGQQQRTRKTLDQLTEICHCSKETVRRALKRLQETKDVIATRRYRFCEKTGAMIYAATVYHVRKRGMERGFTLLPRKLLQLNITHSAFVVLLYLYQWAGRRGSCHPSIRKIARETGLSVATVKRALLQLQEKQIQAVLVLHCHKKKGAVRLQRRPWFACNTYYPTAWTSGKGEQAVPSARGGLIFRKPLVKNNITGDSILRESRYGVAEFGILHSIEDRFAGIQTYYHDGVGVRVSASEMQDWLF